MDNYNLDTFDKDCDNAKQHSKDNNSEILTEEEFSEFIEEEKSKIELLLESISKETVEDIFEHTPFSKSNIEIIERFINSINERENINSNNINLNNIQSKEKVLQILNDMKNFDKMELYKRLRKEDKSDDANKGNIEKVNLRNKIKNTIDKCHEKQPNIPRKELIYTVLEKYFYKESISNFAEEVGVSEDVIKHCLKLNSEGYYYGYRSLEKICKELGIN